MAVITMEKPLKHIIAEKSIHVTGVLVKVQASCVFQLFNEHLCHVDVKSCLALQ